MNKTLKKAFIALISGSLNALSFSQDLPRLITYLDSPKASDLITISKEELENFDSTQEALESKGFSYKNSNDEITFHGYWNSSIKVYIDDVLMNSPNTGKFKWEQIDLSIIDSIKIDTSETNGSISIYIYTNSKDWTRIKWNAQLSTKSYVDSPFDETRISSGFSAPVLMDSGSAIIFKEALALSHSQNHFGIRGTSESYTPELSESYSSYKKHYKGYENFNVNNSFAAEYCSAKLPGATFGFSNLVNFQDANCGKVTGIYYKEENQKDLTVSTSLPVFLPTENFTAKLIPSYMFTLLKYTKNAAFSNIKDEYLIHKAAFNANLNFYKIFFISSGVSYDFSIQEDSESDSTVKNDLFSANLKPEIKFSKNNFGFEFSTPVNYFGPTNSVEFLYKATVNYSLKDFTFGLTATRNCTNPVFQQLYYAGAGGKGNPHLKNEIAHNFQLPVSYNGLFLADVTPFLIFYKNKIAWTSTNNVWTTDNVGSSTNFGADFYVSTNELIPHLNFSANYTFCKALLTTDKSVYGNQIMLTPVHTLNLNAKLNFSAFTWTNSFTYESEKFTSNENKESLCPKYHLDTSLSWTKGMWTVQALWKNLLDFAYIDYGNIPQSGTSFTLSVSVKN